LYSDKVIDFLPHLAVLCTKAGICTSAPVEKSLTLRLLKESVKSISSCESPFLLALKGESDTSKNDFAKNFKHSGPPFYSTYISYFFLF